LFDAYPLPKKELMKIQALTTTLAVLLAVSLAAIVALVVTTDVIGSQQVIADTPAAIQIDTVNPQTTDANSSTVEVADQTGAEAQPTDGATGTTTADEATPVDTTEDPAPTQPAEEPAPTDPVDPGDEPAPTDPAEEPEEPADPGTGEPPCDGTVIDGDCVPISILCLLGYERVGNDCVFVGCPFGFQLNDGVCEPLVVTLPCPAGFVRNAAGTCVPKPVLDPPVFQPPVFDPPVFEPIFCLDGFTWVDGECVPVCPSNSLWVGGFCLPQLDLDLIQLPEFDLATTIGG
jgi:hypothetical protein